MPENSPYVRLQSTLGRVALLARPAKLAKATKLGDTALNSDGSVAVASPLSDFVSFLDVVSTTQPTALVIPTLAPPPDTEVGGSGGGGSADSSEGGPSGDAGGGPGDGGGDGGAGDAGDQ